MLSKILTPFTNLSDEKIKNSKTAKDKLQDIEIEDNEVLVSYDVKSLFTSVPTDMAV